MVREKIGSVYDKVENKVLDTTAQAMASGTVAVRKLSAKKFGKIIIASAVMAIMAGMFAVTAYADDAETVFTEIRDKITMWVGRIGALVIVFGGVNAGIGIANSDDAGRNRGLMTMAGGAILIAVVEVVKNVAVT